MFLVAAGAAASRGGLGLRSLLLRYGSSSGLTPPLRPRSAAMSSDVFVRVQAFATKAHDLSDKGHLLRAAENYGHAAEAARALGLDNLVTLHFQLMQGNQLGATAMAALCVNAADPQNHAAHRAESIALFSGAIEALERRRVADTLLEGKCAAVEVAWRARRIQQDNPDLSAAAAASWAVLFGYEELLKAAMNAARVLACAAKFASECSGAQFQSFAQYVARAADQMQLPRRHPDASLCTVASLVTALHGALAIAGANGLDARLVQQLACAAQRLQRSGVLQARHIEERIVEDMPEQLAMNAMVRNSLAAPGLRTCALPGCNAREAHPAHFKSCAACRTVCYCCREHQVADWPGHKKACKAARKAAAATEEAGGAGPTVAV